MNELNQDKYYYLLRLTRLYANGVFRNVDKRFHPKITLLIASYGEFKNYFYLDTIPKNDEYQRILVENKEEIHKKFLKSVSKKRNKDFIKLNQDNLAKKEIEEIFKKKYGNACKYLISDFVFIDQLIVCVLTEVNNQKSEKKHSLIKNNLKRPSSFTEALGNEYLIDLNRFLKQYARDEALQPVDYLRTIRFAGENFIRKVLPESKNDNLYNKLNIISSLKNEGEESKGKILFIGKFESRDHLISKDIEVDLLLANPIAISKYRGIRKLLELSRGESSLLSDAKYIYGLGKLKKTYNKREESVFEVRFLKHYTWEIRHCCTVLMSVNHEQPEIPKNSFERENFDLLFKRLFSEINNQNLDVLYESIEEASHQKHGTIVVVSDHAEEEVSRLIHQCTPIKPVMMNRNLIASVSGIDGAILMDSTGRGYAIGVILDGLASEYGTSSRGARYNSSIRYIETMSMKRAKHKCIAFVISEDGMIDVITPFDFARRESHLPGKN